MNWFARLFGRSGRVETADLEPQAVMVRLDGVSLSDETYEDHDLDAFENLLTDAMGDLGEYDGHETGPEDTTIYLYGMDAEAIVRAIEPVLLAFPLAKGAVVTLRFGPPGSTQREVRLPA